MSDPKPKLRMKSHKLTLALTCVNLAAAVAVWAGLAWDKPAASESLQTSKVIRAQAIELVDERGQVRAQLHLGEDGGGNLRLRSGDGTIRVKLAGTAGGSALLLLDQETEPAVWLTAGQSGTSITLKEKGKEKHVIKP